METNTDDTQMSVAIAEYLLEMDCFTSETIALNLANHWVDAYKRDPRNAYSRRFQQLLDQVKSGEGLLALLVPLSDRCGGCNAFLSNWVLVKSSFCFSVCTNAG